MNDTFPQLSCTSLPEAALNERLSATSPLKEETLAQALGMFSKQALFLSPSSISEIERVITTTGFCLQRAGIRQHFLARHGLENHVAPLHGGFLCFDFHLSANGPKLIEINSNAGGLLLNDWLQRGAMALLPHAQPASTESVTYAVIDMLKEAWLAAGHQDTAPRIAIIDDEPTAQFLYPEFLLYQSLFNERGLNCQILDAAHFTLTDSGLYADSQHWPLIYNRLTDFYFDEPRHKALKDASHQGLVVLSPSPHTHALYADKRNLIDLGSPLWLKEHDIEAHLIETLSGSIPLMQELAGYPEDYWWQNRKRWFFKTATGYGSRAAYRGDKLTRSTLSQMMESSSPYLAQALAPASEITFCHQGTSLSMKVDIRAYAYRGKLLLLAARLYRGQTTNFRTLGGGFAPVFAGYAT